jgi:hypothetical protein
MAHYRSFVPLAAIGLAFGLYGWAVFAMAFHHDGLIGIRYNVPGTDWMVHYSAARAVIEGRADLQLDGDRFTAFLNARFAGTLRAPLPFHPWINPPPYLLLLVPLALLPFGLSYALFLAAGFAALVAAAWHVLPGRGERWFAAASLLLCPAASITAVTGQNAFLVAALLLGGAALAARRPVAAGLMLGALIVKPQFWLMVPVALAAARHWRALGATFATALVLTAASIAAFGLAPWQAWLGDLLAPAAAFRDQWRQWSVLWGEDVFACALLLGASDRVAAAAQLAASLASAAAVYWCYRSAMRPLPLLCVLLAASCLAAPHLQAYDMVLLAAAATLFLCDAREQGLRPGDASLALALWLLALFNPPRVIPLGFLTPLIEAFFIATLMRRAID